MLDFAALWNEAKPFDVFLRNTGQEYRLLWGGIYRSARTPDWARDAAAALAPFRLLVLSEDWCIDAVSSVPWLARLAESVPGVELRTLARDEYLPVMDQYLTNGSRSIPIVIVLDRNFRELGSWGPRPRELQAWVMANRESMPKDDRTRETRRWYARDRGATTMREVLEVAGRRGNEAAEE